MLLPAVGMAVVARSALVNISGNILMFIIHFGFVVFMAINAFKNSKVCTVYMAIAAGIPFVFVFSRIDGKILGIMIPGGFIPPIGIVTVFAVCGKPSRLVIGVGSIVVIGFVATVAIRGRPGIPICVAGLAFQLLMGSGQWEIGIIVIKRCGSPALVGMTLGTIVIKIPADMIWICCIAVIVCMAAKAIPRQATGLIIDVALNTSNVCMGAFQRKSTPL